MSVQFLLVMSLGILINFRISRLSILGCNIRKNKINPNIEGMI